MPCTTLITCCSSSHQGNGAGMTWALKHVPASTTLTLFPLLHVTTVHGRIKHSSTLQKKHSEPSKTISCKIYYHSSTRHNYHNIDSGG